MAITDTRYNFVQTEDAVEAGVAVHKYGAFVFPAEDTTGITPVIEVGGIEMTSETPIATDLEVGAVITLAPASDDDDIEGAS